LNFNDDSKVKNAENQVIFLIYTSFHIRKLFQVNISGTYLEDLSLTRNSFFLLFLTLIRII